VSLVRNRRWREDCEKTLGSEAQRTPANHWVSVKDGYERWAPTYDKCPNPLLGLEERQLRRTLPPLDGRRVLDLACGTGRWLAWMLSQGASSGLGVDFSPAMLAAAHQKPELRNRLVLGDCRAIPLRDAEFDLAILSFVMGHIRDVARVIREVGRVTAAGADVYVSDLHPLAYAHGWYTGFRDESGSVEIATWPRSTDELLAVWKNSGFDCIQSIDCRLGEPERPTFARAGKSKLFAVVRPVPVVLLCHFTRARQR